MFISLGLALLGQSSIASAQAEKMGSGIRVYPNTGSLEIFNGVKWRYNGEMHPWGSNTDLDFVPMVKDVAAVQALEADPFRWVVYPEIISVFSLEFPYTSGNNISVPDAVELQKTISKNLFSNKGAGRLVLGAPSVHGRHGQIDEVAFEWLKAWVEACNGECDYDFLAFDFESDDVEALKGIVERLHNLYEKPVWIKGLTCITWENLPCKPDKAQSFMWDSIEYFRSTDFVERWVWDGADPKIDEFGDPSGMLMIEDGVLSLTPTGHLYLMA